MRGLLLLALVLLSARANVRAHPQPEHKHPSDHSDHHVKHLLLNHPLDRQQDYPLGHNTRSEDTRPSEEHHQSTEGRDDYNRPPRDSHTWQDRGHSAAVTSTPEDTRHYVKSTEDLNSPSDHHHRPSEVQHISKGSDKLLNNVEPDSVVILNYVNHLKDLRNPSHHHSHKQRNSLENTNNAKTEKKNDSPSEDVKFTSEAPTIRSRARTQTKAEKDNSKDLTLVLEDKNATYEDEELTYEDATYEDRSLNSEDERATYEERNFTSENERATYEKLNLTSEDEGATYEDRSLNSEDERATYEEQNLTSEDESATYEKRNLTSEDESATYEERIISSEDDATYKDRDLTSENYSGEGNKSKHRRKIKHSPSSDHQAPKKTKNSKHFYSSSRVYPKFAKQLSKILRPFFHIQETSDERPFDLTREKWDHDGNSVEIFPLHPTPINQDSKAPLALILGGPKRDKGRKKYFYSKKHKHGHVKASIEILDNESDEKPGNDTLNVKTDNSSTAVTRKVENMDGGDINVNDEAINPIVDLNSNVEKDPVVVLLNDIQSHTVFGSVSNEGDLEVSNNEDESKIDDAYGNASTENVLESNESDFLTEENKSNRYSPINGLIRDYSDNLSSSFSDSFDLSNVSTYPSVYPPSGEKIKLENKDDDEESDGSSDENYSLKKENEGPDVSVTDEKYYSTSVSAVGNDESIKDGIKGQFYNSALIDNEENKNDLPDDYEDYISENEFEGDHNISDSSEIRDEHGTILNDQYALQEILNVELPAEDNGNVALIDYELNNNSAIVTNDVRNLLGDLTADNSEEIELKVENDDDKRRKYVLQFRLPADRKSANTRVGFLEDLKNLLNNHQRTQKSYNLSFLFQ